ncbi:M61 family metallopeptidase [Sphingomonas panacisoli]|uniref:M61 family metallopeptidase n=1 Tax=Sphingomonas panacisoli TaxID=1813879 RepID=A0A5B8LK51_9SPHN|nr:M61 family metallopeptidase [Sphingomonas panacisoli]QDZ08386.1 M61 family metallopeptidase [Sphingomonas panacisoli]
MIRRAAFTLLLAATATVAYGQANNSKPQPVPIVDTIPAAADTPYPGTMTIDIDATDTARNIFSIKETIPVAKAGDFVLLFPKWIPGGHTPRNEIEKVAGLHVTANGKEIPWTRDPVDVYAFHLDIPKGVKSIDVKFQYLSATKGDQGRMMMTPNMMSLQTIVTSLYPAGYFARQIPVRMTVKYPEGWTAASALNAKVVGSTYTYEPTNYEILIDSPIVAGRYYKKWALSPRVNMNVFADTAAELAAATPDMIDAHKRIVDQAVKLYGAQHYDHYEFLVSVSNELGGIGLEHHRSTEIGVRMGYFSEWANNVNSRNVFPHEYNHSWDGKFRRGADLWTPDYRYPMRDSLLWVYEGQTQFWGYILQARSGLVSKQDTLDQYAAIAANLDNTPGRNWRPLIDTTNSPIMSNRKPVGWYDYQRGEEYYNEGLLVWMEVDSMLREQSKGTKSLDDFAKAFFGINDGDWGEVTYTFDDVVATLNGIQPYDWRGFLTKRLTETGQPAPLAGFERNGYKLVYTDQQTPVGKQNERARKQADFAYSLGITIGADSSLSSVRWEGPAYGVGLTVGDTIVAVNGLAYTDDRLRAAVSDAKGTKAPIVLVVKAGEEVKTVSIDYHGGLRYPHFVKTGTGDTGLDRLLTPR